VQPLNARTFLVPTRPPATGGATVTLDGMLVGNGLLALVAGLVLAHIGRRRVT